jgi:hypothetical protein
LELNAEGKQQATLCRSDWRSVFGDDITVEDNRNTNIQRSTYLGIYLTNDSPNFQVKEIEVFEITDETVLTHLELLESQNCTKSQTNSSGAIIVLRLNDRNAKVKSSARTDMYRSDKPGEPCDIAPNVDRDIPEFRQN